MVKMTLPVRNRIYDKIQTAGSLTDVELSKALTKAGIDVEPDRFNKILLDLEIMGLVNVSWVTKDARRIEASKDPSKPDEVDEQNRRVAEKDYEASFPGADT